MNSDDRNELQDRDWWLRFWKANNRILYGSEFLTHGNGDSLLPCSIPSVDSSLRIPVLIELGEDWIIHYTGANYRRYIQDFEYQQVIRKECTKRLDETIGFRLKPKVDTSSLLHGSVYGNDIKYPENSTPWLEPLLNGVEDIKPFIKRMEAVDPLKMGLVPEFISCYRKLDHHYRWRILHDPGSVHGPGTILGFLFGINNAALLLCDAPDLMSDLLSLIADVTIRYSQGVRLHTGFSAEGLGIYDDVAGLFSPEHFLKFFLPVYERLFNAFCGAKGTDRFIHNDAAITHLLPLYAELGVNGINPDPLSGLLEIRSILPEAFIYAGVPPLLLAEGPVEEIYKTAYSALEMMKGDTKFILTTAGSINEGTSLRHIQALCEAVVDFSERNTR